MRTKDRHAKGSRVGHTNAAREAIRKEAANHASKRTWESEVCEWETAVAKYGPDVEYVPSSWGFKHCELDQSQHRFKARIVALGDNVRDYGRLVEKGQLHGRPITLEGSRALDCYAGLQPDDDCQAADAESSTQRSSERNLFAERISHTIRIGDALSCASVVHGHVRTHTFKQRLGRSC